MKQVFEKMMDAPRIWWIGLILGVVVIGGAAAAYFAFQSDERVVPPTPDVENPEALVKVIADERFKNLDTEKQRAYLMKLWKSGSREEHQEAVSSLSKEQQSRFRQNVQHSAEAEIKARMDVYFALPQGAERTAYLDEMIDEIEARRDELAKRRREKPSRDTEKASREGGEKKRRRQPSMGEMKKRLEDFDPVEVARMLQFAKDLQSRMKARGIK